MAETKTINLDVETNLGSLRTQLRQAQAEVAAMSEKFGATSVEAANAAKKAAELRDRIGDAKNLTDAFNPDAKFNSLSKSIGGVLNGFQAFEGALGVLGVENEDLQKQLLKVQSAMALSEGIQGALEAKDSFIALGSVIKNNVVAAFTTLRGALISTGIGALVVTVGYLVNSFIEASEASKNAAEEQKKYNEELKKHNELAREANETGVGGNKEKEREIELLKARGATTKQIYDAEIKLINDKIKAEESLRDAGGYEEQQKSIQNIAELRQKAQLLEIEYNNTIKKQREENIKLENERLANLEKIEGDTRKAIQDAENAYFESKLSKQIQEERAVEEKYFNLIAQAQQYGLDTKILEEARQKELNDISKKYKQKELDDIEEARKKELHAIKEANRLKAEQENAFQLQIEDIDEANFQARLQNSMSNQDYELEQVRQKYFTLEELAKGNAEQEKIIAEAKAKEIKDIELKYQNQVNKAKYQMAYDSLALISNITTLFGQRNEKEAKRAFIVDKAAKLASATISGIEGTINAFKTASASPITELFPAYPFIQAGLAGAFAATNIAKISATQFGSGSGSQPPLAPPPAGGTNVTSPNLSFSMQGAGGGIGQLLSGVLNQPIKAYVVSSDITNAQMLDAKAIKTSVL